MAGPPSENGPAIRLPGTDVTPSGNASDSNSTPQPNATSSSFQAINRSNVSQSDSGRQSRDVSARATPTAEGATAQKQTSQAPALNANKASGQAESLEGPSNYGTRSRRTGKERLNYAEDQDADFDFTSAATTTSYKKNAIPANAQNPPDAKRAKEPVTTNGAHSSANSQTIAKDSAPGATASASTTTNPKKRKAAGTATPTNQTATPPLGAALAAANLRKQAPSALARETNMMSFTRSKGCLNKNGELVADDGTKLNVNGKPPRPQHPFSRTRARRLGWLGLASSIAEVDSLLPRIASKSEQRTSRMPKANMIFLCRSRLSRVRTARRAVLSLSDYGVSAHQF